MISMISTKLATSEISGTPSSVTTSLAKIVAGIKATTEFFAPEIGMVPEIRFPPLITIFFILFQNHFSHFYYLKKIIFLRTALYFNIL